MNKSILITGSNVGLGKEAARQLASIKETEKIILACLHPEEAAAAKIDLEKSTGRFIFEIVIIDTSDIASVRSAAASIKEPIDAIIMNAGGMAGKTPGKLTSSGMTQIAAVNLMGHVVLVDELLKVGKLKKVALFAASESARGIKKMGIKRPNLKTSSVEDFASILNGTYFGDKFDSMQAYGLVKYTAVMWMAAQARKHPHIKFISMSPGMTSGTAAAEELPIMLKIMFKYIIMPVIMPLMGMVHGVEKGAKRYIDGISKSNFESGKFYASHESKVIGPVVDQSTFFADLNNTDYQDNADLAIHQFIK